MDAGEVFNSDSCNTIYMLLSASDLHVALWLCPELIINAALGSCPKTMLCHVQREASLEKL
jgi:hypothetical protein